MSFIKRFVIRSAEIRQRCAEWIMLEAPEGCVIDAKEMTRTLEQSAKLHAICGDLAKANVPWAGKPRTSLQWKVLLVSGHAVATRQGSEMVPGIEGEFVNLRESTAGMSRSRISSLIDYAQAFAADKIEQPEFVE